MSWFNYYGLIMMAIIMIPNIIFAIKNRGVFFAYRNKIAEILEQISRYACIALMIFNIPYTWIGFYFSYAEIVYLTVNGIFTVSYCLLWLVFWKKSGVVKALLLSVIPSLIFLFSGIMIASIPLIAFAIVFAATHILISVKNAISTDSSFNRKKKSIITVTAIFLSVIIVILFTMGSLMLYGQNNLSKLSGMSVLDMIRLRERR